MSELIRYETVSTLQELESHELAWRALALEAVEPNVFYEPEVLLPALRNNAEHLAFSGLLVFAVSGEQETLIGFYALALGGAGPGNRVPMYRSFTHLHCYLCTPLLHRDYVRDALGGLLDFLDGTPGGVRLIGLHKVTADGRFGATLKEYLIERKQPYLVEQSHYRAEIKLNGDSEQYFAAAISGRKRKEYRRLWRRLSEQGHLHMETQASDDEDFTWTDRFLRLEASGWKGGRGLAMDNSSPDSAYFHEMIEALGRTNRLRLHTLWLDDQPISMKCNLLAASGAGGFAFKIAYDEDYAAYSPGVLLELENIRDLFDWGGLDWMDSCADPDHPMIDHLWSERRQIDNILIGGRGLLGRAMIKRAKWRNRQRGAGGKHRAA